MNHRRDDHEVNEVCKHFLRNSCKFPVGVCWHKHERPSYQKKREETKLKCHTCKKDFKTKNGMMIHKNKSHVEDTKDCKNHKEGNCDFDEEDCWYFHKTNSKSNKSSETSSTEEEEQVFQNAKSKTVPPNPTNQRH